jgi:hypothetical protein
MPEYEDREYIELTVDERETRISAAPVRVVELVVNADTVRLTASEARELGSRLIKSADDIDSTR